MEMNFALSPKCHFMVMNSISMKMSIEAEPQLEQHRISNEYFPTQNSYLFKVQKPKIQNQKRESPHPAYHLSKCFRGGINYPLGSAALPVSVWGQPAARARSI